MKKLSLMLTVSALAVASSAFAGETCKGSATAAKSTSSCSGQASSACCSKGTTAKHVKWNMNLKGAQLLAMR